MNTKELEYMIKIAEEQNITKAAEKLFVTPSALTQQLFHLEEELGTPLFFRSRSGCIPTAAGEVYLEAARAVLNTRREAYNKIHDIANVKKGQLSIGFPPERGAAMFSSVYPQFHQHYPDISIQMYETSVHKQQAMIAQGTLDLGFLTLTPSQRTKDEYLPILSEQLLIVLPARHPLCQLAVPGSTGQLPELSLSHLKEESFALLYRESTTRQWIDSLLRKNGISPNVLFETSRCHTILHMVAAGLCCSLVTDYYYLPDHKDLAFFRLPDSPSWDLAASYRKSSYLSLPAKDFLHLASRFWAEKRPWSPLE